MSALAHSPRRHAAPSPDALGTALAALAALVAVGLAAERTVPLGDGYTVAAALVFAAGAGLVVALAARALPGAFGAANRVTLVRGALTALVLALLSQQSSPRAAWFAVALALTALALDGVDGRLARRGGISSRFGARFDMETDALLILALAALAWRFDKAGAWVLAAGLMRYAFVAAARVWPALGAELPPSKRRQTACVVQIAALVVCIAPPIERAWSAAIALGALAALTASFAVDVAWLVRRSASTGTGRAVRPDEGPP